MNSKIWNSEKFLSLAALFVSLSTLIVFVYQTNLIRKQQYMSVYPHLKLMNYRSGSVNYQYVLRNDGVGPAILKNVQVTKAGEEYPDLATYVEEQLTVQDSIWVVNSDLAIGRLIPAGKEVILFALLGEQEAQMAGVPPNKLAGARKLRAILNADDLDITLTYSSIYDEIWEVSKDEASPSKQ